MCARLILNSNISIQKMTTIMAYEKTKEGAEDEKKKEKPQFYIKS